MTGDATLRSRSRTYILVSNVGDPAYRSRATSIKDYHINKLQKLCEPTGKEGESVD